MKPEVIVMFLGTVLIALGIRIAILDKRISNLKAELAKK